MNIIITGGTKGLGLELMYHLSKDNKVIILGRSKEKKYKNNNCEFFSCDIRNSKKVEKTVNAIIKKYNKIDVLINNAGCYSRGKLEEENNERIKIVFDTNILGTVYMTKAVLPYMKKNGEGLIININSQIGNSVIDNRCIYQTSKWALTGFTKSLEKDILQCGIRVTDVFLGPLEKGMVYHDKKVLRKSGYVKYIEVCKLIDYLLSIPNEIYIPEIGIRHIDS